jgi:hypothetical protein
MKTALITLFSFLIFFNSYGQQQATIHNIVTVTLPKNVEKLTAEKLAALKPKNGKTSPISHEQSKGDSYKGKNFLIQLNAASTTPKPNYLEQEKREMDDLFSLSQPQVYSSSIKHFQNHSVVITNYERGGDNKGYFLFKSYNNRGDSILVGILEYNKGNIEVAGKTLDDMLTSIVYLK